VVPLPNTPHAIVEASTPVPERWWAGLEIMRDNALIATSDEHKTAKGAARAGKPICKRMVKSALKAKLDQ